MSAARALARRPWVRVVAIVAALLAAAAGALGAGTRFQTQRLAWVAGPQAVAAPAWSRPCWRPGRRAGTAYTLPCGRVEGRVLHVQEHDPDGDGDRHLVVLAGPHVVIVKVRRSRGAPRALPGIGHRVEAVGILGSGRLSLPVVETDRVRAA
jgi:hypothetical protein